MFQMGMYTSKPQEATRGGAIFRSIRDNNPLMIANNYMGDLAFAMDKKADLAAYFYGKSADVTGKFK
jgi:hypothetical protein